MFNVFGSFVLGNSLVVVKYLYVNSAPAINPSEDPAWTTILWFLEFVSTWIPVVESSCQQFLKHYVAVYPGIINENNGIIFLPVLGHRTQMSECSSKNNTCCLWKYYT